MQQGQEQQQPPQRKRGDAADKISGVASSLTALVSASNAARYGSSSFRNKETGGAKKAAPSSPAKKSRMSK
ncbi:hypothetical protein BGZ54_001731 [Gamsiella multidivaricata]|nr:hypothetical protein BGZ54_001731 [Gamsiella multidivaricata]